MSTELIEATKITDLSVTIKQEALTIRDGLIAEGRAVIRVDTDEQQQIAVSIAGNLRQFVKNIESTRVTLKAPCLDLGKKIDETAKLASNPAKSEIDRLEAMVATRQRKIAEEAEAARRAEEKRQREEAEKQAAAQREAVRLERERIEAENARLRAELAAAEAKGKAKEQALAAALAAKEASEKAASEAKAAADAIAEAEFAKEFEESEVIVDQPTVVVGAQVKHRYVFEVSNIHELYKKYPQFVKVEPRTGDLNSFINNEHLWKDGEPVVPGLIITKETKVAVRATHSEELRQLNP